MARKVTQKIKIWGIVQGVGFRPFVAKVAQRYGMKGRVLNIGGLVEIVLTDTEKHITEFLRELQLTKPAPAEIVHISRTEVEPIRFDGFEILHSDEGGSEAAMIPADLAICPDCLKEMYDKDNPRYKHPFISCMACGPRYTIIDRFPYDRENTSMIDFPMCGFCEKEYTDIDDRRYHAQTISCHDCGPQMEFELNGDHMCDKPALQKAAALLKEGRVIAFKSMGGYNLIANPMDEGAVADLRRIKRREEKPFAVMFRDIEQVRNYCRVTKTEEMLLESSARPILLLERYTIEELQAKKPSNYQEFEKSRFIGSFLPSMGAQYLLMDYFGGPLIVTSANFSDMPIIKDEDEMLAFMQREVLISEAFYNERKIRVSVDDSVVRVIDDNPQMIRRSKGYAPVPLYIEGGENEVFATGGQLKNSFSLSKGPFAYVSQYFGDLDSVENQNLYEESVNRMGDLFRIEPKAVVVDMHPGYYTTGYGKNYAKDAGLELIEVQHHHAHVASVMAEHNLKGPVLGVSFDGTGYGTDGKIWGGEFLICEGGEFTREAHLKYVKMIGGDSSMKEGWKSALSYMHDRQAASAEAAADEIEFDLTPYIDYAKTNGSLENREWELAQAALESGINVIESSSMGRLFDGVAAMLGICRLNSYEGQCAIMLEDAAARARRSPGVSEADDLALHFHDDVIQTVHDQCIYARNKYKINDIALTGGVFQNRIITEGIIDRLRAVAFNVYCNISVSPNDGGIALGQTFVANERLKKGEGHGN